MRGVAGLAKGSVGILVALALLGCAKTNYHVKAKPTEAFPVTWDGQVSQAAIKAEAERVKQEVKLKEELREDINFRAAVNQRTVGGWLLYFEEHPIGVHTGQAINWAIMAATALPTTQERDEALAQLVAKVPAILDNLPAQDRLRLVGPPGLQVKDLLRLLDQGIGQGVLVAKVKASGGIYRNFSLEELGVLKNMDVPDDMVSAMIESTAQAERNADARREQDELRSEIANLKRVVAQQQVTLKKQASTGQQPSGGPKVQTKDGLVDTAMSCAKRLAALELCKQIPWPGDKICKETAKSNFPCGK